MYDWKIPRRKGSVKGPLKQLSSSNKMICVTYWPSFLSQFTYFTSCWKHYLGLDKICCVLLAVCVQVTPWTHTDEWKKCLAVQHCAQTGFYQHSVIKKNVLRLYRFFDENLRHNITFYYLELFTFKVSSKFTNTFVVSKKIVKLLFITFLYNSLFLPLL